MRFGVDADDFREFQRQVKGMDKELAKSLNKEFRRVINEHIIPAARSNAAWSARIPGAIKPQVTSTRLGARVDRKQAPHARPFEGLQRGLRGRGFFRHPVFGNREVWVNQQTRPFLQPAFDQHGDTAVEAAEQAVTEAARTAGFK